VTRGRRLLAARYLRLLASVENLAMLHMDDELRRALAAVDPIDARELANEIEDTEPAQVIPIGNPAVVAFFPQSLDAHRAGT
jgi:hypothetical protein